MGKLRFDEADDDTSSSLVTEGKRRNVEKEKVLSLLRGFAGEDGSLDGRTIGYSLIRVDVLVGLLADEKKLEISLMLREIRVEPPTKTISWTFDLLISESWRTFSTSSRVLRKRSWQSSSKRARVRKVTPSKSESISG